MTLDLTAPTTVRWGNARQRGTGRTATYRVERLHDGRFYGTIRCNGTVKSRVGEGAQVHAWVDKIIESRDETTKLGGIW